MAKLCDGCCRRSDACNRELWHGTRGEEPFEQQQLCSDDTIGGSDTREELRGGGDGPSAMGGSDTRRELRGGGDGPGGNSCAAPALKGTTWPGAWL